MDFSQFLIQNTWANLILLHLHVETALSVLDFFIIVYERDTTKDLDENSIHPIVSSILQKNTYHNLHSTNVQSLLTYKTSNIIRKQIPGDYK